MGWGNFIVTNRLRSSQGLTKLVWDLESMGWLMEEGDWGGEGVEDYLVVNE